MSYRPPPSRYSQVPSSSYSRAPASRYSQHQARPPAATTRSPSSRHSRVPPSRSSRAPTNSYPHQQPNPPIHVPRGWTCNKCKKPLAATLFVCSCNCVFCEECTYSHFQSKSTCPTCMRPLQSSDLLELVVANPTSATENSLQHSFQSLFTKRSPNSNILSCEDTCHRLLKSIGDDRRTTRFLCKQFIVESQSCGQQSGGVRGNFENIKKQIPELKQVLNTAKIEAGQIISELQHRLQALQGKTQEQQQEYDGKTSQVNKVRQSFSQDSLTLIPPSSHSRGSGGSRGSRGSQGKGPVVPPIQGFLVQKQARDRAKSKELEQAKRSSAPLRSRPTDIQSIITPITPVPPPYQPNRKRDFSSSSSRPRLDISHTRNVSASSGYSSSYSNRSSRTGSRGSSFGFRR